MTKQPKNDLGEVVLYRAKDGKSVLDVRLAGETVWLTQKQMAELFDSSTDNIGLHLKNIYTDRELEEPATTEEYTVVQQEGRRQVQRDLKHFNLDAIISVGYRVNSRRGVHFRQWATRLLKDHLTRGYTLNRQRLEQNAKELEAALTLVRRPRRRSPQALSRYPVLKIHDTTARHRARKPSVMATLRPTPTSATP